ncbi:MAG: LicD family protein [Lachnospiraceae bacterium]|nr:LicD family protein [Lachnospiraceae bacterium]
MEREGREISQEELKEIQRIEKELIAEVDRICKKKGIHYNMVGGTMLGAIRHQDHIPWDDDADIGFLRSQYERFREACKTELDQERFYFQDFRDTPGYRWGYGKLRRKGTAFVRLGQEFMPYEQGVFIDLMPFDSVPDGWLSRRFHFFRCFLYRKFLWSAVGERVEKGTIFKQVYRIMNLIPERVIKKSYAAFIKESYGKRTELVRILTFPTPKGCYGYKKEWYTDLKKYRFGNLEIPGAADYDGYLTVKYGNYMKLPPEEKRKVHPISKLVLTGVESNG